jgi:CubicO group peptidase (beta-lactamase class C family)
MRARLRPACGIPATLFLVHAIGLAAQTPQPALLQRIDSIAQAEFAHDSVASLTIGVVTRRGLVWTKSYGFADMSTKRLANRESVYRIGSITKMFTAVMLQQLVAAGKIRLTDPAERFYPEIREIRGYDKLAAPITVQQLATMTAGIAREPEQEGPFWTGPVASWDSTLHLALSHTAMDHTPGTRFLYSNIGYAILGATLGRAAGVPYIRWEKEHVFGPLGMRRTAFEVEPAIASDVTRGYDISRGGSADPAQSVRELITGRGYKVPNGAIFTTVDDLSRFLVLLLGGAPEAIAPRARLDSVFHATVSQAGEPTSPYGLGFMVAREDSLTYFGHGGAVAGYGAFLAFDRDRQVGVITLRNAIGGPVNPARAATAALAQLVDGSSPTGRRP